MYKTFVILAVGNTDSNWAITRVKNILYSLLGLWYLLVLTFYHASKK